MGGTARMGRRRPGGVRDSVMDDSGLEMLFAPCVYDSELKMFSASYLGDSELDM